MTDDAGLVGRFLLILGYKIKCSGESDLVDVFLDLFCGHTDTVIFKSKRAGIVIVDDPYGILSLGVRAFLSLAEFSESSVLGYGIGAVRYELTHEDVLILIQPLSDNRENILSGNRDLSALCFHLYHLQKSKQHYLCAAIYSAV